MSAPSDSKNCPRTVDCAAVEAYLPTSHLFPLGKCDSYDDFFVVQMVIISVLTHLGIYSIINLSRLYDACSKSWVINPAFNQTTVPEILLILASEHH